MKFPNLSLSSLPLMPNFSFDYRRPKEEEEERKLRFDQFSRRANFSLLLLLGASFPDRVSDGIQWWQIKNNRLSREKIWPRLNISLSENFSFLNWRTFLSLFLWSFSAAEAQFASAIPIISPSSSPSPNCDTLSEWFREEGEREQWDYPQVSSAVGISH